MGIFESHAHYEDKKYNADRDELLSKVLPEANIEFLINVGTSEKNSFASIALAEKYDYIYASVGIHPNETYKITENTLSNLFKTTENKRVVAVGEIGLDFHYPSTDRETQKFWFKKQLAMAETAGLPLIIHSRDADEDTYQILQNFVKNVNGSLAKKKKALGVIHCFSQDADAAEKYAELGFYIGIGGVVTYKGAANLAETIKRVGISRILTETDCPYLPPVPKRGERNSSQNLTYIVDKISEIAQISRAKVIEQTRQNGIDLFLT